MGIFTAIGAAFSFIPIPLWPPAGVFGITYDPAAVPAAIGSLSMGTGPGTIIGILGLLIHWLLTADTVGVLINIISIVAFVVPLGLICRRRRTTARMIVGLLVGSCCATLIMIPTNLIVWPFFFHMSLEETAGYIVPLILPFNAMKAILNSILVFGLYYSLRTFIER
jgi:riboflavin transporter FmnP